MEVNSIARGNQNRVALALDYDVFHFNLYSFLSHSWCSACVFDQHWSINWHCWANTVTLGSLSVMGKASLELGIKVYVAATSFTLCIAFCLSAFNFLYNFIVQSFSIVRSSFCQFLFWQLQRFKKRESGLWKSLAALMCRDKNVFAPSLGMRWLALLIILLREVFVYYPIL